MTNATYNDADWLPPGAAAPAAAPPVQPQPASQEPVKIDAATGHPIITVHPRQQPVPGDYGDEDWKPSSEIRDVPYREVSPAEAVARGYIDYSTFGLAPALYGAGAAGAAGKTPEQQNAQIVPGTDYPGGEAIGEGLHRLWSDHFGNTPDPQARAAYHEGAQSMLDDQKRAQDQRPIYHMLGQLGAALSMPGTLGRAAVTGFFSKVLPGVVEGITGRIGGAALTGGLTNAAQSTGAAISEGRPEDIPKQAGLGFVEGAGFGAAGGAATEAVGTIGRKIASIVRGRQDTDAEAGRRVVEALRADTATKGSEFQPAEAIEAQHAGTPMAIVDVGRERTRALARSAANTSPGGREALETLTTERFQNQGTRISRALRQLTGGAQASTDEETLARAARRINKPAYARAYTAGDRPINVGDELMGSPAVIKAIGGAATRGKDKAIADGMGGFRPAVTVTPDGRLVFNKGPTGVPTYPNLQFWDYVQRELRDTIGELQRGGRNEEAATLTTLRRNLLERLDNEVPEFNDARRGAAAFFGAEDALEAGRNFVMRGEDIPGAVRALAGMSAPERELFARGFASDLADKIEQVGFDRNVLNSVFLNNSSALRKIQIALGPERADQFEALLRSEAIIDKARKALGNSTTVRQAAEAGLAGGGAVATFEAIKEHDFNPGHILAGAFLLHTARHGLQKIDQKVAQRVGEMLASDDPAILQKGLRTVNASPTMMTALRELTAAGGKVGAKDISPGVAAAAALTIGEDLFHREEKEPEHRAEDQYNQ